MLLTITSDKARSEDKSSVCLSKEGDSSAQRDLFGESLTRDTTDKTSIPSQKQTLAAMKKQSHLHPNQAASIVSQMKLPTPYLVSHRDHYETAIKQFTQPASQETKTHLASSSPITSRNWKKRIFEHRLLRT